MRRTWLFAVLCAALTACARPTVVRVPVEVPVTVYETVAIPEVLLKACKVALPALNSNSDLESALAAHILALRQCDQDKDALRELKQ